VSLISNSSSTQSQVSRAQNWVSGPHDWVSGAHDRVSGAHDRVSGADGALTFFRRSTLLVIKSPPKDSPLLHCQPSAILTELQLDLFISRHKLRNSYASLSYYPGSVSPAPREPFPRRHACRLHLLTTKGVPGDSTSTPLLVLEQSSQLTDVSILRCLEHTSSLQRSFPQRTRPPFSQSPTRSRVKKNS
jgi:hypothetical protein